MSETTLKIRVTYKDTDQTGIVYYGNYMTWFEMARTEHIRSLGVNYKDLEHKGEFLPVLEVYCKYRKAACYDDIIHVSSSITHVGKSSLKFAYKLSKNGDKAIIAEGWTAHCFCDREGKPTRVPQELTEILHASKI